ncbi:DNA internalization-related competence protein ComEC/Rec2 [Pusillimonas caeni]|uniref:DNA internalization-related competence protein ComEC/Rec2 n=1 Tax=Pusillimonas caeni TaxID=1348472 RepID=UPI000E59F5FA|nr:DNA internalization-related competence protein ComEC/Rec2 [Pusillimonas caeni]TFL11330.1 DNA internalization-related competence protein ComEC/Rec2 [Pusillimonas caeni]
MMGRISLLAGLTAAGVAHVLPRTPEPVEWAWLAGGLLAATLIVSVVFPCFVRRRRPVRRRHGALDCLARGRGPRMLAPVWAFMLGLAWVCFHIDHRLSDSLSPQDEDKVSRVVLRIATLPRELPGSRRFEAEVLASQPSGIPRRILVSWHGADYAGPYRQARAAQFPDLVPGQVWRMSLNLRRPHGASNPHGFDYEGHVFAQGLRAVGSVRGTPRLLYDEPGASLALRAERARHRVRQAMLPYVRDSRYGAVLLALAIGDQAGVPPEDWTVFNRTSITHLISISGSHITMLAALGGLLTLWLWKRLAWRGRPLAERAPAQVAACLAALCVAWLYCLLAGWGVPARRTFLMLAVLAAAHLCRLPLGPARVLLLAAGAVVALDPWALMASGFWLSFGAVAVLLASGRWMGTPAIGHPVSAGARLARGLWAACRLQLIVTAGLMPILATLFNEISIVSPIANAYAIPVISLVVTPLSLLLAAVSMMPGLEWLARAVSWLAHEALQFMMVPTHWLASREAASLDAAAAPWWTLLLALAGMAMALLPRGLPARGAGWLLVLPALLWRPERPPDGAWDMVAVDVGQGAAVLVLTSGHALLFDTGVRHGPYSDAAARSIVPLLRAKGVRKLDVLVVSHADIDHAGGLRSILEARGIGQSYSSFNAAAYLRREAALLGMPEDLPPLPQVLSRCHDGVRWEVDGVAFDFMWPLESSVPAGTNSRSKERNAQSCVLRIRGGHHSALLTGDIATGQEDELVRRALGPVDVVAAAHHGSRSSSGRDFVAHTAPAHVIAQAGRWNRYGHPHPTVQRRWQRAGARFWRTDLHGAVTVRSRAEGLVVESHRQARQRHWSGP